MFSATAEHEKPRLRQGVVKRLDDALLEGLIEVDENVAAAHQVELRERWVSREIVLHEDAHVSNALDDAIAALGLREKSLPPLVADVAERAVRVEPRARGLDRLAVHVRPEDLDGSRRLAQEFDERDRQRVDLLSGRAPGHPHPNGCRVGFVREQDGEDVRFQALEDRRIAEERRDVDEGVLVEGEDLLRCGLEEGQIRSDRVDSPQRHPPREAALEGR